MSRPRRVVQDVVMLVRVTTADTRETAPERVLRRVRTILTHEFGNAVTVKATSYEGGD